MFTGGYARNHENHGNMRTIHYFRSMLFFKVFFRMLIDSKATGLDDQFAKFSCWFSSAHPKKWTMFSCGSNTCTVNIPYVGSLPERVHISTLAGGDIFKGQGILGIEILKCQWKWAFKPLGKWFAARFAAAPRTSRAMWRTFCRKATNCGGKAPTRKPSRCSGTGGDLIN